MNLNNLTFSHFEFLHNGGYNLDHVFLLMQIEIGLDFSQSESPKMKALHQGIYRKGLITENGTITLRGKELLKYVETDEEQPVAKPIKKVKIPKEDFEAWWKAYPGTDTFSHKGIKFGGTRSLRTKRDDCKLKFDKIIAEGEYTVAEMIAALNYEVLQKKENSVKQKANKLSFLQNSLTYLNQRTFEPFIELVREGSQVQETTIVSGGTDV